MKWNIYRIFGGCALLMVITGIGVLVGEASKSMGNYAWIFGLMALIGFVIFPFMLALDDE